MKKGKLEKGETCKICSTNVAIWSTNIAVWSTNVEICSTIVAICSTNVSVWSTNVGICSTNVKPCKNARNGECKYGKGKCWYRHTELEVFNDDEGNENKINETKDILQGIVKTMEALTNRIIEVEHKINDN